MVPEPAVRNAFIAQRVAGLRQSMIDRALTDVNVSTYSIIQPKYDGWWCGIHIIDNRCYYITSGGQVKRWIYLPSNEFAGVELVLIGEYMYGTQWAQTHNPGSVVLHDISYFSCDGDSVDYTNKPYGFRLLTLESIFNKYALQRFNMSVIESYSSEYFAQQELWQKYVLDEGFEGLVFKSPTHIFGENFIRVKRFYTRDFVCVHITEGGGRLAGSMGSLVGAVYDNGTLKTMVSVGGGFTDAQRREIWEHRERYIGKVFEVKAWALFDSGSLRHPNFIRWRDDKEVGDCKP